MRLTKLGHACVRLEKNGAVLVIDPGAFSEPEAALTGANAVLITHEHFDHVAPDSLRAALAADPGLQVWSTAAVAGQFDAPGRVHTVGHGDTFTAAGFDVHVYGSDHAVIHQDIPIVANVGFMIDGEVFHPGDALTVPEDRVGTLLLPVSAPWLKVSEMIDYGRTVAAPRGYTVHDALFSDIGLMVLDNWLGLAAPAGSAPFTRLAPGESAEL